jgi:hypothetical protein
LFLHKIYNGSNSKLTMKTILCLFLSLLFLACSNSVDKTKNGTSVNHIAVINKDDSIDYCTVCDSLDMWQGGIQGVDRSDSTGSFLFGECHTNKACDLLYVSKGDILRFKSSISDDSLSKYYDNEKDVNYKNLDCYSFVIKKTEHKKQVSQYKDCDCEDLDSYDYVFPSTVSVFKRTHSGWQLIKTKHITSFEQMGRLKLNTIFHID